MGTDFARTTNFEPQPSLFKVIAANIKSPPSLETLLAQINGNFAVPLLAQWQKKLPGSSG